MPHDKEMEAMRYALGHLAGAVEDLLTQLQSASTHADRATLQAEFDTRVDGLRADLAVRHGLTDRRAGAILAQAVARVCDLGRAVTTHP